MRFTINRRALNKGVNVIQRSIAKAAANPILVNVLLELKRDGLSMTSNNGILTIQHKIPNTLNNEILINNIEEGSILIKSELLTDLVRKLDTAETITFEVFDDTIIKIESSSFSATVNGIKADEYVDINLEEDGEVLVMDARRFIEVVDQTAFAASNKDKPPLNAIHFVAENGVLDATATDTTKLAAKTVNINSKTNMVFNLNSKTADIIARMCEDQQQIRLCVNKNRALFSFENTKVSTQLIPADYPNTKNIKINSAEYRLEANTTQLLTAIERVSSLSTINEKAVKISMKRGEVRVSSKDEGLGSANERLTNVFYDSEALDISCSFLNITNSLKALRSEEVVLEFNGEMRPFKISNPRDKSISIMITPVRPN